MDVELLVRHYEHYKNYYKNYRHEMNETTLLSVIQVSTMYDNMVMEAKLKLNKHIAVCSAATTIQAAFRGWQVRNRMRHGKL